MVVADTSVPGISTLAAAMPSRVVTGAYQVFTGMVTFLFRPHTGRCTGFAFAAIHDAPQVHTGEEEALA